MTDQNATETKPGVGVTGLDYPKIEAMVGRLAAAIAQSKAQPPNPGDKQVALRADYQTTVEVVKLLSDIRFRCLVFVTAIITVANALVPGTVDPGARAALGSVGFLATLGIAVYELRNSQLYEAAIHRATVLETKLGALRATEQCELAGLFNERPLYVEDKYWKGLSPAQRHELKAKKSVRFMSFWRVGVKHDHGLALIYGAALGGWVYLIANGLLSLPPPGGLWPPARLGLPRIISALLALLTFAYSAKCFVSHDRKRFRPQRPAAQNEGASEPEPPSTPASVEKLKGPGEASGPPQRRA